MGIFSKLKQTFSSKKDGDRYLSGLDKSKKSFSERIPEAGTWLYRRQRGVSGGI